VSRDKVVLILLLAVVVALAVVAWGLAGGQPKRSEGNLMRGKDRTWSEDLLADVSRASFFPKPKPTRSDELSAAPGSACLGGEAPTRVASLAKGKTCKILVAARDGERTRKLVLELGSEGHLSVRFAPKGGLPGSDTALKLPTTVKDEDGDDETRRDADLRVPEGGAELTLACGTDAACKVSFVGLALKP